MEEYLHQLTIWLATMAEMFAAIIIGIAAVTTFFKYFLSFAKKSHHFNNDIRLQLGRTLALGLEFLLAADILKTAVAPNWHDLGMLAAIAILRTALNYFLEKELRDHERRKPDDDRDNESQPVKS